MRNYFLLKFGPLVLFLFLAGTLAAQTETLRINEFMALNRSNLTDEDDEYPDWIEIYNPTAGAIDLYGWSLTDNIEEPGKWVFPHGLIGPGEYLVVFASGKNRAVAGQELHTNFRLEGSGEYLALIDQDETVATEFNPRYPEQQTDFSFGMLGVDYVEFRVPTPGSENLEEGSLLPAPSFDVKHGLFENPFSLILSTDIHDADIYYTTDGSNPDDQYGTLYTAPISISETSVIRAVAVTGNGTPGRVGTQTYIFPADVIQQPNDPEGYPSQWGPYTAITGTAIADYEMDPEMMADPAFAQKAKDALAALPTISLVSEKGNFFSLDLDEETGGIYIYTGAPGDMRGWGWERPVSFEYFDPNDTLSLQVDCGVRIQGGHSRRPEKSPKHSFLLVFRGDYGASRLNFPIFRDEDAVGDFNNLILRAGFGLSWVHHSHYERVKADYIRDAWTKDSQRDMGHPSSRSIYAHLYINGIYWGVYAPSERLDAEFGESYMGGKAENYDVIKDYAEVADGEITAWNEMMDMANAGLQTNEAYQRIQGNDPDGTPNSEYEPLVDVVNLADYMMVNFYGGNTDWDHHNWAAMRNRVDPGKGFKFLCWDAEHMIKTPDINVLAENNDNCPSRVFQRLAENEDFQRLFADRVQKYCYGMGQLAPAQTAQRYTERMDVVGDALDAEAARWGDYRRDVHQYQPGGPFELYAKQIHWIPETEYMLDTYFPQRTEIFLEQLRNIGFFPQTEAPEMKINDEAITKSTISEGDVLTLTAPQGIIYYTENGSDPASWTDSGGDEPDVLVPYDADKRALVPKSDIGTTWRSDPVFDDANWQLCQGSPGGVGYETGTGYADWITLDVTADMRSGGTNPNTSCYVRIPFSLSAIDLEGIKSLFLSVLYDDGFVAYLNGNRVAEANAPTPLDFESASDGSHEAHSAETFNISAFIGDLNVGENLLALHGLNTSTTSTDFLVSVKLSSSENEPAQVSEDAVMYSGPITLDKSSRIRARAFNNGEWSAMNEKFFTIPGDYRDIKVTEIHYHPLDQDEINGRNFEFIELKNTGSSTLDLGGLRFIDGIDYKFPAETALGPKQFVVVAADNRYFFERYGFYPDGKFSGQLNNGGEMIILATASGDTLSAIYYNISSSWPQLPDGYGYSLVPKDLDPVDDQTHSSYWRASYHIGGSPGKDDTEIVQDVEEVHPVPEFEISRNYPNPFTERTHIFYELPEDASVQLSVINMLGQEVVKLVDRNQPAGAYTVDWDGTDGNHQKVSGGFYFYRIVVTTSRERMQFTRKMLLIR